MIRIAEPVGRVGTAVGSSRPLQNTSQLRNRFLIGKDKNKLRSINISGDIGGGPPEPPPLETEEEDMQTAWEAANEAANEEQQAHGKDAAEQTEDREEEDVFGFGGGFDLI